MPHELLFELRALLGYFDALSRMSVMVRPENIELPANGSGPCRMQRQMKS